MICLSNQKNISDEMKNQLLLLILIALVGCVAPDTIVLNRFPEGKTVILKMLNGIDNAQEINQNSFRIFPDAIVSLKFVETTQNSIQFEIIPENDGKIEMFLYTTQYNYPEQVPLKIILSDKGYSIEKENKVFAESDTIKLLKNQKHYIKLQKDANLLKISINCAVIPVSYVLLNATEYLIIRTDERFRAVVQGIDYSKNY